MLLMRHGQHRDGAGYTGGASALPGIDKAQRIAVPVQPVLFCRRCGRRFAAVIDRDRPCLCIVADHEGASAETGALRLDQTQHHLHGNGGIDRIAAAAQCLQPGLDGQRMGGGDHRLLAPRSWSG